MDPRERLREHRLHAQLQRRQRRVLARGALAVVVAADDEPAPPLVQPLAELRVAVAERELGDRGNVRAVGHHLDAVGRQVARGDVVRLHRRHLRRDRLRHRLVLGRGLDVGSARDLDLLRVLLVGGLEDVHVVHVRLELRLGKQLRRIAELPRIGDLARQHRGRGDGGRAQVHAVVRRAAAAGEVAVHGAQRIRAGGWRLAHSDTRAAHRLEHAHAGLHQLAVDARLRDRRQDLARARRGGGGDLRVDDLPVEQRARQRQVGVAGVDRRADAHLSQAGARDLLDRHHVGRALRLGHEGAELVQVDLDPIVVLGAVVGPVLPLLPAQPVTCLLVRREDRRCGAQLGDHVRDRAALGDREVGGPRAGELEHLVLAAAHTALAQQLQDDVLGLHPGPPEGALQPNLDHLRTGDLVGVARHRHGHVEPARADRDHPERTARRGVGVGTDEDAARLGVALDVHVVADAVPGARVVDAELPRHRLEHPVVVGVLEVELDDVVVHVLDRAIDAYARYVELLELHAGGVLEKGLVHAEADRRARLELALHQVVLEDLVRQVRHSATT